MEIGTGKPTPSLRKEIPHHGLDLVDPEEPFHVARYLQIMVPVIQALRVQGKSLLLVGGSGLYLKGLLEGLCPAPGKNPVLRQKLLAHAHEQGSSSLHGQLQVVDPLAASRIHPHDTKRIVRALEVFESTARPISDWQRQTEPPLGADFSVQLVGLTCEREELYRRIEARVDRWLASGWLEEARTLSRLRLSQTAREALGYRELYQFLEEKLTWEQAVSKIKQNSRRYAKRQWSWFRQQEGIHWIAVDDLSPEQTAQEILSL